MLNSRCFLFIIEVLQLKLSFVSPILLLCSCVFFRFSSISSHKDIAALPTCIPLLPEKAPPPSVSAATASTLAKLASFMKDPSEELIRLARALGAFPSEMEPQPFHREPSHSLQQDEGVGQRRGVPPRGRSCRDPGTSRSSARSSASRSEGIGPQMYPKVGVGENGCGREGGLSDRTLLRNTRERESEGERERGRSQSDTTMGQSFSL